MSNVYSLSPVGHWLLWSVLGKPVEVVVSRAAMSQFPAKFTRHSASEVNEFGGILFGRIEQNGENYRTYVEALEPLKIEHSFGNTFVLSSKDRDRLRRTLRKRHAGELTPVGWYRSHERRGLYLAARDMELYQTEFPHAGAVVLLLRQEDHTGIVGGFFIREGAEVQQHDTYLKFLVGDRMPNDDTAPAYPLDDRQFGSHYPSWVLQIVSALAGFVLMVSGYYAGRALAAYQYHHSQSEQVAPVRGERQIRGNRSRAVRRSVITFGETPTVQSAEGK
jgi:proteasome lid subunit RPN8/RPN11